jgi:hypothetical protein
MAGDDTCPVGFNPFRQQRRRTSDYVYIAAGLLVCAVLLAWGFGLF